MIKSARFSSVSGLALLATMTAAIASSANAAPHILYSGGSTAGVPKGDLVPGQSYAGTGTLIQIKTDSGATVSLAGNVAFAVGADGVIHVERGSVTIVGETAIQLGSAIVTVSSGGSATFNVGADGLNGRVVAGSVALTGNSASADFKAGQSFMAVPGGRPRLVFASTAQAVPGNLAAAAASTDPLVGSGTRQGGAR